MWMLLASASASAVGDAMMEGMAANENWQSGGKPLDHLSERDCKSGRERKLESKTEKLDLPALNVRGAMDPMHGRT